MCSPIETTTNFWTVKISQNHIDVEFKREANAVWFVFFQLFCPRKAKVCLLCKNKAIPNRTPVMVRMWNDVVYGIELSKVHFCGLKPFVVASYPVNTEYSSNFNNVYKLLKLKKFAYLNPHFLNLFKFL